MFPKVTYLPYLTTLFYAGKKKEKKEKNFETSCIFAVREPLAFLAYLFLFLGLREYGVGNLTLFWDFITSLKKKKLGV